MSCEILFTDSFKRQFKKLKKKYPHIKDDLKPLLIVLEEEQFPGDSIPGLFNRVFKVRFTSSDMKRGKSGGYRLIYYRDDSTVYLLTVYSKAERENIPVDAVLALLKDLGIKLK